MEKIIKELDELSSNMKKLIKMNDILISKLHQPTVISTVCDCKLLGNRKQYEFNLNECRLCVKQLKAN